MLVEGIGPMGFDFNDAMKGKGDLVEFDSTITNTPEVKIQPLCSGS